MPEIDCIGFFHKILIFKLKIKFIKMSIFYAGDSPNVQIKEAYSQFLQEQSSPAQARGSNFCSMADIDNKEAYLDQGLYEGGSPSVPCPATPVFGGSTWLMIDPQLPLGQEPAPNSHSGANPENEESPVSQNKWTFVTPELALKIFEGVAPHAWIMQIIDLKGKFCNFHRFNLVWSG